jgi:hypothetical protein
MTMRVKYACRPGAFKEAFTAPYALMAQAAQQAVAQAGDEVKTAARANIASAGLGPGFVKALRVDIYPRRRNSLNASAHIYHRIPYAGVFEEGETIRGKPRLWIPLRSAPQKIGKKRMTPQEYVARVGPLQFVQVPGRNPLLFARMKGKRAGGKVTLGKLRAAKTAKGSGATRSVPIFVGVDAVTIRKRLDIGSIVERASNRLAQLYAQAFRSG